MSIKLEIERALKWPYIRYDEMTVLETALTMLDKGLRIPARLADNVEFILEKYS